MFICSTFGVSSSSSILITSSSIVAAAQRLCFFRECVGISQKISGPESCSLCCSQPLQLLQRCFMKTQESENLRKLARLDTERMSSQGDWSAWMNSIMLYLPMIWSRQFPVVPPFAAPCSQGCWGWKSQGQQQLWQLPASAAVTFTPQFLISSFWVRIPRVEWGKEAKSSVGVERCKDW